MLKKTLLIVLAAILCLGAEAKKNNDNDNAEAEEWHVKVALESGDTITGYIRNDLKTGLKNLFSKGGLLRQYINVGAEPKGGETHRYHAREVKEYRFLEATEAYPEGAVCVSEMINAPKMFKSGNCMRGFVWQLDKRESGSVLKWEVYESTGGRNSVTRVVPAIGIKFKGAKAAYAVMMNGRFFDGYLMLYLKKAHPELREAWNQYYHKGKDAKAHRKELLDNASTALLFYEDFLRTHDPINDETPAEESTDESDAEEEK